ncbi:hypothetical protein BY458DRAFT_237869 [Sporodiniella umbellata]|nr:hypothetical protein BY458DRAFT_237869 [Sporodiniella umbellata]
MIIEMFTAQTQHSRKIYLSDFNAFRHLRSLFFVSLTGDLSVMGVQGLWSLVGPSARPTQLESLRRQKIAIDASIWIHQFMRTMRDGQGNPLQNGHLLGFFRRLCKLLFYDIKPVFVFDGGAPSLKRNTITERRKRREGIKVNMKATARKLLTAQMKSRALADEERRRNRKKGKQEHSFADYGELEKSTAIETLKKNHKLDQYELPPEKKEILNIPDPRLSSVEEMKAFVNEFAPTLTDVDSDTFQALPPEIQYEVIQDLKLKSRQTSWARLDQMVRSSKTDLDFSKQQIKLLKHRNEMTQRVMQMNTVAGGAADSEPSRVAGERGRQYVLYKNDDMSQGLGWSLPGLSSSNPLEIDISKPSKKETKDTKSESPKEDKVKAAMAKNPKLAGLFSDILTDEESTSDEDESLFIDQENEKKIKNDPLESSHEIKTEDTTGELLEDMGAYVDDEAIDQVISKIYKKEMPVQEATKNEEKPSISLDKEAFLSFWLSQAPDAFIYLNSFNEEYKKIIRTAILDSSSTELSSQLTSIRKLFGKTRENDELLLEALQFQEKFLGSTIEWKRNQEPVSVNTEKNTDESILLDEDYDDQNIQFFSSQSVDKHNSSVNPSLLKSPIHINLSQSLLQKKDLSPELLPKNHSYPKPLLVTSSVNDSTKNQDKDVIDYQASATVTDCENADTISDKTDNKDEFIYFDEIETVEIDKDQDNSSEKLSQGYNSEEELENHIQGEDDEYARFVSDIASKDINTVKQDLYFNIQELKEQKKKAMGNSDDVTSQMVQEIQELLKLFGIPFIVSPMEAEAQCAALERLNLVEGTITDDSDVFLFGASRVYKNMFNQQRLIECYKASDIEREMMLKREEMIQLAYLLGSDYTEGIPGIGPVAAMEILAEFSSSNESSPTESPLQKFKVWYQNGQDTTDFQKKFVSYFLFDTLTDFFLLAREKDTKTWKYQMIFQTH